MSEPPPPPECIEGDVLSLEPENQDSHLLGKYTLIGKIISRKLINKTTTKTMILKGWGAIDKVSISDIGPNKFLFHFTDEDLMKRIIREAPWNVLGNHLNIQPWNPELSIEEVSFNLSPFWIQIHGLPIEMMTVKNASSIGSKLGSILRVENPMVEGHLLRSFFRVKVLINISKSFITGFWLPRKNLPRTWIKIKYEKLMDFCYNCGKIGHDNKVCNSEVAMSLVNPNLPRFSSGIGVPFAPSLESIVAGNVLFRKKANGKKEDEETGTSKEKTENQQPGYNNHPMSERTPTNTAAKAKGILSGANLADKDPNVAKQNSLSGNLAREKEAAKEDSFQYHKKLLLAHLSAEEGPSKRTVSPSPTLIDLTTSMPQPGLGPANMEDLHLEKEDIGLTKPAFCLDYPSPTKNNSSFFGVSLSLSQINRVKQSWTHIPSPTPPNMLAVENSLNIMAQINPRHSHYTPDPILDPKSPADLPEDNFYVVEGYLLVRGGRDIYDEHWQEKERSPIITDINPGGGSRRDFRFEAFWEDHEDCCKVIDGSWNANLVEEEKWTRVLKKTSNCRRALTNWSKKMFRKADKDVAKLKAQLTNLLNSPSTAENQNKILGLKKEIDDLWKQEEKY
ncbi:Zinc finger, CCHC-type [Sesbania bispinosa]|nr:Zinc finger, CCHC-type [Sesbania bispinosa]